MQKALKHPFVLQIFAIQLNIPHCYFGLEAGGFITLDKSFILTVNMQHDIILGRNVIKVNNICRRFATYHK